MQIADFHKDFRLNGIAFTSVSDILEFTENKIPFIASFLYNWFDSGSFIKVQTSGSTGKPKNIRISKQQMKNSALATGDFFNLKNKTKALLCLSTDYIAGKMMLVRALTLGWDLDVEKPKSEVLKLNKLYDFTAMVSMQVQESLQNVYKVKKLLIGGGTISKELEKLLQEEKTTVFLSYGMTETVTHIAIRKVNYKNSVLDSYYKVLPDVLIGLDKRGCLVIDAPKVSKGLVYTNDLVKIIDKNHFVWLGRIDNVINSGGVKIIPEQVEEKLAVIISSNFFIASKKDTKLGKKVILLIEGTFKKELIKKIKNTNLLSKFEKPKEIHFINTFIYTKTNKINRLKSLLLLREKIKLL